jgi:hypothetical protein
VGKLDYYADNGENSNFCFSFKARNVEASVLDVTPTGNKKYALVFAESDTATTIMVLGLTKFKEYKNRPWSNFDPFLVVSGCCSLIEYWTDGPANGRFYLVLTEYLEDYTDFNRTAYGAGEAICVRPTFDKDLDLHVIPKELYYTALIRAEID